MPSNESGGVRVLPVSEGVCLPRIGKPVRVRPGVAVEGAGVRVIPRYVRIKGGLGAAVRGGHAGLSPGQWHRGGRVCSGTGRTNRRPSGGWRGLCGDTGRGNRSPSEGWRLGRGPRPYVTGHVWPY